MRFRHRAQQALCYQLQHRLFANRQAGQVSVLEIAGRDHCMVVGHFFVVDDRTGITGNGDPFAKRHGVGNQIDQHRQSLRHIRSQIAAVRAGIGAELLFVQILEVVQGLLGRISQQSVGIPLEGSQVIEGGRLFQFVAAFHLFDRHIRTLAGGFQLLGSSLVRHAFPGNGKTGQLQDYRVKRNRLEGVDLGFPLDDERQCRGHDAPNIQSAVVQHRKQSCGVDTNQPVRLGAAESSLAQTVIIGTGAQVCKALPYGGVLHRGNPQPLHGFAASRQLIDAAENQFALASGITGVYHLGHIRGVHQLFQHSKLFLFVFTHHHLPVFRQDGQIVITPLSVVRVIYIGIGQPGQMTHAPADPPAVTLQIPVFTDGCADHGGQTLCNRRFFSNHKFHHLHPPILPAQACAVFSQCCFPHPAAGHSRTGSHSGTAFPANR